MSAGDDLIMMDGVTQYMNLVLVNPYSGEVVELNDTFRQNTGFYDGGAGNDILRMSQSNEYFLLDEINGQLTIQNIELVQLLGGHDVFILAHPTLSYGTIQISGSTGNDVLWGNNGNDTLLGVTNNDHLVGGGGDDYVDGGSGTDYLNGGTGIDQLEGGIGDDTLRYTNDAVWDSAYGLSVDGGVALDTGSLLLNLAGYGRSFDSFNGGSDADTLIMGDGNDALILHDDISSRPAATSGARVLNIEILDAGAGDDVVDLHSITHIFTNRIILNGGEGNDWLRAASFDDVISAGAGHDTVRGMGGHDQIHGDDGDDTLYGGIDNDILYGDDGDDTLYGENGHDVLYGGNGLDTLVGGTGDDVLRGGLGIDRLEGGDGDDIIYGGNNDPVVVLDKDFNDSILFPSLKERVNIKNLVPSGEPSLGVAANNLQFDFAATATITFRKGYAGYKNTLGAYGIDADGNIVDAKLLFENVKDAGTNVAHTITLPTGTEGGTVGFFIISNGYNANSKYNSFGDMGEEGSVKFYYDYGKVTERVANIADDGAKITAVWDNGVQEKVLKGDIYHTTPRDEGTLLNADHKVHAVTGLAEAGNDDVLRIGFEDLKNLGDGDYEDVLFDININPYVDDGEISDDILIGGAGSDTLYGEAGDDILVVGEGLDTIRGGSGMDTIAFDVADGFVDLIYGFETGALGDTLNLTDVLDFAEGDVVADYVRFVNAGADTHIQVNADGAGTDFVTIATFVGGVSSSATDMLNSGNLVLTESIVL